ncbi:hypothetical protein [Photobacterium nomapromontoriensis]|uniref:hypothetical protein n=1 Tax=Photobacterium nomapromontoriensis TaxID=2910237 RepID=UPI003D13A38B
MMQIYQLKERPEDFRELQLGLDDLLEQIGEEHLMALHKQRSQNTSLLPIWKNVKSTFGDVLGKDSVVPDVSLWASTYLVLNAKAYASLNEELCNEGEFLPITADGENYYIFNCLSFGQEDETTCVKKYLDGIEDGIDTLFFDDIDVAGRYLFKSKLQGCQALYATEHFKELCEQHLFKGLRYETDLLAIF